jgi:NAD(P)-dependent dehydrogenase (short-subunit alcohol dehydrogenase family)
VYVSKPFTDYTAADYTLLTGVNLGGFFRLTQRVIAEMVRRYGGHVNAVSPGIIQTPVYPADSYEGLRDQLPRSAASARSAWPVAARRRW